MTARQMALAAPKGHEPAQRTNVGRGEAVAGMGFAQQAVQQIQRVVVTADGQQGVVKRRLGTQQVHCHGFPGVTALAVAGDADDAVGTAQAGDGSRAAWQGHGHDGSIHPAQLHAQTFLHAGARGQRVAGNGRGLFAIRGNTLLPQGQQGQHKFFHGDTGRNRITGNADNRLAAHHSQNCGLAGHDRNAVHQHFAQ